VEVCPISQIIIVGEHGVGKTTLLYRLQGRSQEEIDQIKSTVGVDCHTRKYGFIVTEDELSKCCLFSSKYM
jgi:GTPase SAR1 family protein